MSEQMIKKIESFLEGVSVKSLLSSSKKISDEYRHFGKRLARGNAAKEEEIWAYLVTRMPATYAALLRVFHEIKERLGGFHPISLMDVGSGPATTLWAAADCFSELAQIHCVEKDAQFFSIGKRLSEDLWLYPHVHWMQADMRKQLPESLCDIVIASYSLGEIAESERWAVVEKLWARTNRVLIVIEPGTPKGFESVRALRKQLIDAGAHMIAPCPHHQACPMLEADWCHFYARLNRCSLHRKVKDAQLNYEDEKFSYVAFSRTPVNLCPSRVLRHPRKGKGHVRLRLCATEGLKEVVVTKKERELYALAKKSHWGDCLGGDCLAIAPQKP